MMLLIRKYFFHEYQVHEDDLFPKCVCSICWSQVRSFHGFYELVRNKQTSFLSRLIKHEDTQRINEQIVNNLTINDDVFHANEMFSGNPIDLNP